MKLFLSLIPSCVLCTPRESGGNVLKTFLRVCMSMFHGCLCLSWPNCFGMEKVKISVEPFPQPILSQALIFSDFHLSRVQCCSLAYLAGSPEIIAKYSWQVSDKACWCSARVLDSQIAVTGDIYVNVTPFLVSLLFWTSFCLLNKQGLKSWRFALSKTFERLGSDFSTQLAYGQGRALEKPVLKCTIFQLLALPAKERSSDVF